MAEPETPKPIDLGTFSRRDTASHISMTEVVAGGLSVLWLLAVTLFFVFAGGQNADGTPRIDSLRFVMTVIAVFMPVALIWVAAVTSRSNRIIREESERLQSAINAMRQSHILQQQSGILSARPAVEQKLDEIAASQRKTATALSGFGATRTGAQKAALPSQAAATPQTQASLELGTPAAELAPPLSIADFIRALNFPETAEDKEGFAAMRRALQDRSISQLIQAAQDVLTLLSQDGIYMDDLTPDPVRPEVWRRFAQGERGQTISAIGGIRDRSSLALAAGRMRNDMIFRDAAHHFIRKFDHTLSDFEKVASDEDILLLTDTRSARAFMLLGRATGTFG